MTEPGLDLVTGGAGFIGAHLTKALLRIGRRVRVIDDLSTGRADRLSAVNGQIELMRLDLASADLSVAVAGVERIFHLAAIPSVPRSVATRPNHPNTKDSRSRRSRPTGSQRPRLRRMCASSRSSTAWTR